MADILSPILRVALAAGQARLEQVSVNAANATTPGYRRGVVSNVETFASVMDQQSQASTSSLLSRLPVPQQATDFTQGPLQSTGRPLDVAIEGKGLFILTNGSQQWLTRAGAMHVNSDGLLTGPKGLQFVGADGPMAVGDSRDLHVDAAGRVLRKDQVLGQLRVVTTPDSTSLTTNDGLLFQAPDGLEDVHIDQRSVKSGFLEGSNANSLSDMTNLMETVRHFESLIRIQQGYDEVLGKAIQKLSEV